MNNSKINKILNAFAFLILLAGCKKEVGQTLPYSYVDVTLTIPSELSSLSIGSATICPDKGYNGLKGIIIYRDDLYQFKAYERLCRNYPNDTSAIVLEDDNVRATCPTCGSQYELVYGTVITGPAKFSLKTYTTSVSGNFLYIRN
jgi:nitrite reductase/ring-hydroxylating ferredoxin subunit